MDFFKLLPKTTTQTALAFLPLKAFQKLYEEETLSRNPHQCTFSERYQMKYGNSYPKIQGTGFETDEHQYLFCAAWFHKEVGYRSHLLYPIANCLLMAIKSHDVELIKYFKERTQIDDSFWQSLYLSAIETGDVEVCRALGVMKLPALESLPIVANLDVANYILESADNEEILLSIYRDISYEQLDSLKSYKNVESGTYTVDLHILHGLILSGDSRKIARARNQLSIWLNTGIWKETIYL